LDVDRQKKKNSFRMAKGGFGLGPI
jgi:hypothetical protein